MAPILPDPVSLMSFFKKIFVNKNPNGTDPHKYENAIIKNVFFFITMFILIFYTHKENIKRLINNTESKTKIY